LAIKERYEGPPGQGGGNARGAVLATGERVERNARTCQKLIIQGPAIGQQNQGEGEVGSKKQTKKK